MIASIKGRIVRKGTQQIVLEQSGIGFLIEMPARMVASLPPSGEECTVYTFLHVRENELALFGFQAEEEKKLFELVQTVSGIGPKLALQIVDAVSPGEFALAILQEDVQRLTAIRGVGKKGAARMILELKDKLKKSGVPITREDLSATPTLSPGSGIIEEAGVALAVLGYSRAEADEAIRRANPESGDTVETLLKRALKHLAIV